MNAPEDRSWIERTGTQGRDVEQKLTALQDSHRLAIHMVEPATENKNVTFNFPEETIKKLSTIPAESIDESLRSPNSQFFSLSLIPSNRSGISMRPFEVIPDGLNNYGYLVDLSQTRPHPARIVRVSPTNLDSGAYHDSKNFGLNTFCTDNVPDKILHDQLRKFYCSAANFQESYLCPKNTQDALQLAKQLGEWRNAIIKAIATNPRQLSEQQLDMLGQAYDERPTCRADYLGAWDDGIAKHNEILAACHRDHLAAIVVPAHMGNLGISKEDYDARLRLQAALVGLDHLDHGVDLPVVIYDIDWPESKQKIHFVGQTKRELTHIALEALSQLKEEGIEGIEAENEGSYYQFIRAVQQHLNIDITEPADGPDGWIARAKDAATLMQSMSVPALQSHRTSPGSGGRC